MEPSPSNQDGGAAFPSWSEAERLAALDRYAILDNGREEAFDDVAALAADVLDAPIAVVNLIAADRQWFKAEVGIGTDTLPLDVSICRHAILQPGIFVVPDLTQDRRFDGNPLVHVAGGLRFYAGALLETPEGMPLGTVCVLDRDARPDGLTERQERALRVLANQTMARIELRRSEAVAQEERARAEKHARRLSLLAEASTLLLSASNPGSAMRDLFALIADEFRLAVGFHYRCGKEALRLVAAAGLTPEQEHAAAEVKFGQTVCGIVAASREAVHLSNIQTSDDEHVSFLKVLGLDTYFSAPLISGGDLFGTVSFGRTGAAFSYGEVEALRTLAAQLAAAIERGRAEAALREFNETLEQRVAERTAERDRTRNNARDLLLVVGTDGVFRAVNPAWTAILGWQTSDIVGHSYLEFIHPDDHPSSEDALETASQQDLPTYTNRYRHKDGSYRWISWVAAPEAALIYASGRDVTDERSREEELNLAQEALRQAQKMEAVGQLTGGLAHDFNNLLTGMMGNLELLQLRVAAGKFDSIDRFVNAAQGAGRRAAALTHRLLAFSRRQTLDPKPTDVNQLINGMEELIRRSIGPEVNLEVVGAAGLWPALIDPGQLENALLNLAINARDAMPDGGRLTIETANKWLDDRAGRERDLAPGQYLSVCVTDTGTGMTPEVIARAFDPFYTTKPLGEGTGLGLSMIYGFARQSGGQVRIYSEVGAGTTMCVYLPRYAGGDLHDEEMTEGVEESDTANGETVLVIDDEPTIRHLIDEVLDDLGYTVIGAPDGAAGLKVLQSGARIDLLITDGGLPGGMNGRQVADAARVLRPGLRVLFITGYAENAAFGNGHLDPGMELLTKPFALNDLARRVSDLLAKPA